MKRCVLVLSIYMLATRMHAYAGEQAHTCVCTPKVEEAASFLFPRE